MLTEMEKAGMKADHKVRAPPLQQTESHSHSLIQALGDHGP